MSTPTNPSTGPESTTPHAFAARVLASGTAAIAADAAERLISDRPEIETRLGDSAFMTWKAHIAERVAELSAAVAAGSPDLFSSRVAWARQSFAARDLDGGDLDASLVSLRDTLRGRLPDDVRSAVEPIIDHALAGSTPRPASTLDSDREPGTIALRYLRAALEGRTEDAINLVLDAVDQGDVTLAGAYTDILLPAQRETGRMWHMAEINIAEEHLVTAVSQRTMALLAHRAGRAADNGKTVVTAAVAGNRHDIGLIAISDFFARDGWRVIALGADIPARDIALATVHFEADLLLLSAALGTQLESLRQAIDVVRSTDGTGPKIMVGGAAFGDAPNLWRQLGADGYAADVLPALETGDRLVGAYGK